MVRLINSVRLMIFKDLFVFQVRSESWGWDHQKSGVGGRLKKNFYEYGWHLPSVGQSCTEAFSSSFSTVFISFFSILFADFQAKNYDGPCGLGLYNGIRGNLILFLELLYRIVMGQK